jgi:D-sedoheptulose 7-phosphate isomerase
MELWEKQFYFAKLVEGLDGVNLNQLLGFRREILEAIRKSNNIFVAGNGGSNAIASHFVTDLNKVSRDKLIKFSTYGLGQNSSLSSAIANDYGFDVSIVTELSMLAKKNDLLVVISSSGTSKNILNSIKWAKENKVRSFALTGFVGSKADELADSYLNLNLPVGDYGPAEDIHSIICHAITNYLISDEFTVRDLNEQLDSQNLK